ncbi:calcium-binding protein [Paracoccus sp. (in: a-proteobacteria)]|uniref:calcium-binding protein n=1 Tax=Paracoccus sp. TaxID=267 RepID=UPI003A8A6BF8
MAIITATEPFRLNEFDMNVIERQLSGMELREQSLPDPQTGELHDAFGFVWKVSNVPYVGVLAGNDFVTDNTGLLSGGTIVYYYQFYSLDGGQNLLNPFKIDGISVPAEQFVAAVYSESTTDDQQVFAAILAGDDVFYLSTGDDQANGFDGNDFLLAAQGNDALEGGAGNDGLMGGSGNDRLTLDAGDDTLSGGDGNDWVLASGTARVKINLNKTEMQDTGRGTDTLSEVENARGGSGNDRLNGTPDANILQGGAGRDVMTGMGGNDRLIGGGGADRLTGGAGKDILSGGAGADRFIFRTIQDSGVTPAARDVITDFRHGVDKIVLSPIDADPSVAGNNRFHFAGENGIGRANGGDVAIRHVQLASGTERTLVLIDTDADIRAESVLVLRGHVDLSVDDFIL